MIEEVVFLRGTYGYLSDGELLCRVCSACGEMKDADEYDRAVKAKHGKASKCKSCRSESKKKVYHENEGVAEQYREKAQRWRKANYERYREQNAKWEEENPEKAKASRKLRVQRRRARKLSLPEDLTVQEQEYMENYFGKGCALTGDPDACLDHVIPLATGRGGTTLTNVLPLRSDLNSSKHSANIFEWFEANRERFDLPQYKFDIAIEYVASLNRMAPEEYREYVYECHANPKEELK